MKKIYRLIVEDKPGVLDRIVGLIRRYGWNISFLMVFETGGEGRSLLIIKLRDGMVDDALTARLRDINCVCSIDVAEDAITDRMMEMVR